MEENGGVKDEEKVEEAIGGGVIKAMKSQIFRT